MPTDFDPLFGDLPGPDPEEAEAVRRATRIARRRCASWPAVIAERDRILRAMAGRKRRRASANRHKYVRLVGGLWQARAWLPADQGGSINLGLYPTEEAAASAVRAWIKAGGRPDHGLPPGVLPKYVQRRPDGRYDAAVRKGGNEIRLGPFPDPGVAFRAMRDHLLRTFGVSRTRPLF